MSEREARNYSQPAIALAGLQIWVHGREFPESDDYWDGNWLRVTVHCGASGAEVWVSDPLIHLSEIAEWLSGTERLHEKLVGSAGLKCMEPELHIEMEMKNAGHLIMIVNISPDHLAQRHEFTFELDQSYLLAVIAGCREVLGKYPLMGLRG